MSNGQRGTVSDDLTRHFSIGVAVRAKQLFGLIVDLNGDVLELPGTSQWRIERGVRQTDVDTVVSSIAGLVSELRGLRPDLNEQDELLGLGVSIGGHINGRTGRVILCPQLGWTNPVPLAGLLKERTGLVTVVVENDVNALATGELFFGDVAGSAPTGFDPDFSSSFAVVTLTNGIGVGLVLGNELYRGVTGIAGELGHFPVEEEGRPCVCGKHGCLETVAGGMAILESMREAGRVDVDDLDAAAALVRQGDEVARDAFERAGRALGRGLAGLVNLLNLSLIILCADPVMLECEPYMEAVRGSLERRAFSSAERDCQLRLESRTLELEARGAASLVFDHLYDHLQDRQPG